MAMPTMTMARLAVLATEAVTAPVALIVIVASSLYLQGEGVWVGTGRGGKRGATEGGAKARREGAGGGKAGRHGGEPVVPASSGGEWAVKVRTRRHSSGGNGAGWKGVKEGGGAGDFDCRIGKLIIPEAHGIRAGGGYVARQSRRRVVEMGRVAAAHGERLPAKCQVREQNFPIQKEKKCVGVCGRRSQNVTVEAMRLKRKVDDALNSLTKSPHLPTQRETRCVRVCNVGEALTSRMPCPRR
jgi:hypothetical protein